MARKVNFFLSFFKLILVFAIIVFGYVNQSQIMDVVDDFGSDEKVLADVGVVYGNEEVLQSDIEVVFCPSNECLEVYNRSFSLAEKSISCAFYEFDSMGFSLGVSDVLKRGVEVSFIVDEDYLEEEPLVRLEGEDGFEVFSNFGLSSKLMHDKFCVIDNRVVLMGSANPTENGFFKNNNNILRVESKFLAENYLAEFEQMKSGLFSTKKESVLRYNNLSLIYGNESYRVSSYFCPQDDCEAEVLKILGGAQEEIFFASFSFTNDNIEDMYLKKFNEGVFVSGVVESRGRNTKGSRIYELNESFDIFLDKNKNNMHHKFFVVDSKYVITGSMNPTGNGVKYNDENILIIENERIALLFRDEFLGLVEE